MHQPRKRFGQHFLEDKQVISSIVHAIHPKQGEAMVEIGPGLGVLTKEILPRVGRLDAIELDRDLIAPLTHACASLGTLIIHSADVLRFDFRKLYQPGHRLRVVGNLPYNISTPLIFHLLSYIDIIHDMSFMLQKEVVERIVAHPGDASYGRLSVMVQYYCEAQLLFTVSPQAFNPPPKVESAILYLKPHAKPLFIAKNIDIFADVVRRAFGQRRKTVRNSLKQLLTPQQLEAIKINPQARAEELTLEDFVRISNHVQSN